MSTFKSIGVLGGGAWGTALAQTACLAGCDVTLWAREPKTVEAINTAHENSAFLKGIQLDKNLTATTDLQQVAHNDVILMVTPAQFVRNIATDIAPYLKPQTPVVICAKGIETATSKLMSDVLSETLPQATPAILSGPSFASEIAKGLPTAVTLATNEQSLGMALSETLSHKALRPYWSDDLIGVQIGGAIKNVLAIAAGIVVGKQLGASAHASLITRGFTELTRFATSYGADPKTLNGLSGLGDLILTCSSPQSRNMSLGIALGEGHSLDDILASRNSVSEGVYTAKAVTAIAKDKQIQMPICDAVTAVISGKSDIDNAIATLLSRPLKAEG